MTGLMGCLGCDQTYEIGLPRCPHCGTRSPMHVEGEADMPTITSGGASNAGEEAEAAAAAAVAAEQGAEVEAAQVPEDAETVTEDGTEAAPAEESAAAEPEGETADGAVPVVDVTAMTKAELQGHADSLGLPTSGSKADLAARITDHVESQTSAEAAPAAPADGTAPVEPEPAADAEA